MHLLGSSPTPISHSTSLPFRPLFRGVTRSLFERWKREEGEKQGMGTPPQGSSHDMSAFRHDRPGSMRVDPRDGTAIVHATRPSAVYLTSSFSSQAVVYSCSVIFLMFLVIPNPAFVSNCPILLFRLCALFLRITFTLCFPSSEIHLLQDSNRVTLDWVWACSRRVR